MEPPHRYPYNPKWGMIILGGLLFGAGCVVFADKAVHNRVGLIIDGIITLGPTGATAFYWILEAFSSCFVVVFVLLAVRCICTTRFLEVGTDALLLPHGSFQSKTSSIPYAEVQSLSEVKVGRQTFLHIVARGRKFTLTASLLPDAESYCEIREFLVSRVRHACGGPE